MQRRPDAEPSDASITVLPNGCSLLLPRHLLPEGAYRVLLPRVSIGTLKTADVVASGLLLFACFEGSRPEARSVPREYALADRAPYY